ncbi:DUF3515 family protein [Clavibacter michiganensis]|uniref:DUF3515 family protein n=1 Tax=Clavibacter michiganensis TaxID=28447 RepID=UPI001BE12947|nr:DUF3515 family protein [Clavibacter michiganensis]MBT1634213.1 DUF3515 family protein [Clavibacter michiganensis]
MTPRRPARAVRAAAAVAACGIAVLLAGCAPTVSLEPAAGAADPLCADVVVHLPAELGTAPLRETDAQGTGAWGDPQSTVILRCGVATPGPTTDACISYDDVDWVEDDSKAPNIRYTTFGRTPAVEVVIDSTQASYTALTDLSGVVSAIPQTDRCVSAQDLGVAPPPGS